MPEGPEVRIVANQISRVFRDGILRRIKIIAGPYQTNSSDKYESFRKSVRQFKPMQLVRTGNHGKMMFWELLPVSKAAVIEQKYMTIHLGMSGEFKLKSSRHDRIQFIFDLKGTKKILYFQDQRNFGTFALMDHDDIREKISSMGPNIFVAEEIDFTEYFKMSHIRNQELAKAIMDQKIVAGIGNYLRAEIFYVAGVDGMKKVRNATDKDIVELYHASMSVIKEVMTARGTPNYTDLHGKSGSYNFKVYGQEVAPNGSPVKKITLAKRTFYSTS